MTICIFNGRINNDDLEKEFDTIIMRTLNNPMRCMKNRATGKALEMEARGAGLAELLTVVGGKVGREMYAKGDPEGVPIACGPAASLIHEIKPIAEVVTEMVTGAYAILSRIRAMEVSS